MRILHFGDLHFGMENYGRIDPKTGLHSRFGDFSNSFKTIIDYAVGNTKRNEPPINKEGAVDMVIFAGDAFKTRDPSPTYVRAFAEGIRVIADAGIPMVLLVGNHDLPNATGKANTLDIFTALQVPGVTVSREPEFLKIKTKSGFLQIVTLPWMYKSQLMTREDMATKTGEEVNRLFQEKLAKLWRLQLGKVDEKIPAVGVVHATVEGASFGSERSVLLGSDIVIPQRFLASANLQYVALGHIHRHQFLRENNPPIAYSGSLERIDFGEEEEKKGFVICQIEKLKSRATFIPVSVRPFQTIRVKISENDPDPTNTVVQRVKREMQRAAVVRVLISCDEARAPEIRETPIRVVLEGVYFVAGIIKQVAKGQRIVEEKGYSDKLLSASPLEVLEEYLKKKQTSPQRIYRLRDVAKELLESVENR